MRPAKFNAVSVGEISVNFIEQPSKVLVKGAFINTENGQTHGWTTCSQWSPDTVEKLRELRMLMERDMAELHFADFSSAVVGHSSTTGGGLINALPQGLGEALGSVGDGVPQT